MDQLQEEFNVAMAHLVAAQAEERPLWEELQRLGSDPWAAAKPDLADRWYAKRIVTNLAFEKVKKAVEAIKSAGGVPSLRG